MVVGKVGGSGKGEWATRRLPAGTRFGACKSKTARVSAIDGGTIKKQLCASRVVVVVDGGPCVEVLLFTK